MPDIRVRFAPSPTGPLHIGSLRTALFNWLFARKHGGALILRIEDTDQTRYVEGSVDYIFETFKWYGLTFDEGPIYQSKRTAEYKKYADTLIEQGNAYYCFCSPERLEELRKMQIANKLPPGYDGHCRLLEKHDIEQRIQNGEPYVIRMKVPRDGTTGFDDIVRGHVSVANKDIDDQILIKSDGFPTYHLANVVDDHDERISHVIRAEEWLPSTPKHILLYQAFGWDAPQFAHPSLLLGTDRSKLSKRHGATAALAYRDQGYLPAAVLNFIALLGWNPKTQQELFSLEELIQEFDLRQINKSGAIFDLTKLDWLNGLYIRRMPLPQLAHACAPWLGTHATDKNIERIIGLFQERLKKLSEIKELTDFFFIDQMEYDPAILVPKKSTREATVNALTLAEKRLDALSDEDFTIEKLKDTFERLINDASLTNMSVLWPLRVALTGRAASPGVFEVLAILGKSAAHRRIQQSLALLKK